MAEGEINVLDSGKTLHGSSIKENDSTDHRSENVEQETDSNSSLLVAEYEGPMEMTDNEPKSHQMVVEQWIQREWVQQNEVHVDLSENPQYNEIGEGQTLLGEGLPPACENDYLTSQASEPLEVVWERMICDSEQERRQTSNVRAGQQIKRTSNGVTYEVPDFMEHNMVASALCCCPFGWMGLIFSEMCRSAKAEGKRKQSQCLSVTAAIMFVLSVIVGIFVVTIVYYRCTHSKESGLGCLIDLIKDVPTKLIGQLM